MEISAGLILEEGLAGILGRTPSTGKSAPWGMYNTFLLSSHRGRKKRLQLAFNIIGI